jgi:hypothetical protein
METAIEVGELDDRNRELALHTFAGYEDDVLGTSMGYVPQPEERKIGTCSSCRELIQG